MCSNQHTHSATRCTLPLISGGSCIAIGLAPASARSPHRFRVTCTGCFIVHAFLLIQHNTKTQICKGVPLHCLARIILQSRAYASRVSTRELSYVRGTSPGVVWRLMRSGEGSLRGPKRGRYALRECVLQSIASQVEDRYPESHRMAHLAFWYVDAVFSRQTSSWCRTPGQWRPSVHCR